MTARRDGPDYHVGVLPGAGLRRTSADSRVEARIPLTDGRLALRARSKRRRKSKPGSRGSSSVGPERCSERRPTSMGRYPFVCAYRRYLKGMRAKLCELTLAERERKLHYLSKVVHALYDSGVLSTTNPSKFMESDVIELFVALKNTGIARETLRKHMAMLKAVTRECKNFVVDDLTARGKIMVGTDHREPFSLESEEIKRILEGSREVVGWKGAVARFSVAMMTFMRLRPGELRKATLRDMDTRRWVFFVGNPKGKGLYGEEAHLPVPDVLKPYVLEFLDERERMLKSKGVEHAVALIPAISAKGVGMYSEQAFGRLKKAVIAKTGISFKWKDFRASGGQIALDNGVTLEQVSRSMRHASVVTTERYYCRARADLAYARVNDAYNRVFEHEPAITEKSD